MATDATIVINLPLFGESYKIKASPEKEEVLRKYAHLANSHFDALKLKYVGLKDRDYMSMAIMSLFGDLAEQDNGGISPDFMDDLKSLNEII